VKTQLINLPIIKDLRGNLTYFENGSQIPFNIKHVRWIPVSNFEIIEYELDYVNNLIIALTGSFEVLINSETCTKKKFNLNRSYNAVLFENSSSIIINNMSTNSLILLVAG
jgi:hypothetical protein